MTLSAQFLDFLELAANCTFLNRKLTRTLMKTADGYYLSEFVWHSMPWHIVCQEIIGTTYSSLSVNSFPAVLVKVESPSSVCQHDENSYTEVPGEPTHRFYKHRVLDGLGGHILSGRP